MQAMETLNSDLGIHIDPDEIRSRPRARGRHQSEPEVRSVAKLRILVADDHEAVRHGLRRLLQGQFGLEVCGEAVNGWEALEAARQQKPDIAVLDFNMPLLNGVEATRQIRKTVPEIEVLILTAYESENLVRELLLAGAHGYVLKSDAARDLVMAIESLGQHRPFFTSTVGKRVLEGFLEGCRREDTPGVLTPRERQITQLLAEGKSNKEVASHLNVSVKTAETHRANLMRKLHLHSVCDLVHYGVRNQIIEA